MSWLWFWRGLRGHSVTFSVLFASVVLGASIYKAVHHLLSAMGANWLLTLLIPFAFFRVMARSEERWFPDPERRRVVALSILLGSILLSALIVRLHHS
jgi:hypothetical protein